MSLIFWKRAESADSDTAHEAAAPVNEQHPLPTGIYWGHAEGTSQEQTGPGHPLPVQTLGEPRLAGVQVTMDFAWLLALGGYGFVAGDADQNDVVTAQTSFANTTPAFLFHNPLNSEVMLIAPQMFLAQAGTVAGGDITINGELVRPSAYASGGTSELVRGMNTMYYAGYNKCLFYSGATATAGYGITIGEPFTLAPDVSPAEGVINVPSWAPPPGTVLAPGSSLNLFISSATTGVTLQWRAEWYEIPMAIYRMLQNAGIFQFRQAA